MKDDMMSVVKIVKCDSSVLDEKPEYPVELSANVYINRLQALRERMKQRQVDIVVIYGDREHFSNLEYFSKYDCRFEEALLVVHSDGRNSIVVGNEGKNYCRIIPYPIEVIVYGNFSLQGQIKELVLLDDILRRVGLADANKVGVVGVKYLENVPPEKRDRTFDIPAYILNDIYSVIDSDCVINFTYELTGLPDGLRMKIRDCEEIAYIEYQSARVSNVVLRLFKAMQPGMNELELSSFAKADFNVAPTCPMVCFGEHSLSLGLASPSHLSVLADGDVAGLAYSGRGSLIARFGIAAADGEHVKPHLRKHLTSFYAVYWLGVAAWYEALHAGCSGGELYQAVTGIMEPERFGITLNPGHNIGMDEWTNSPIYKNSPLKIESGSHIQCDIIASSSDPVMTAICEDTIVIADAQLRGELKAKYPAVSDRLAGRQQMMRNLLKINISDDVLPMGGLNGVYFPYMLDISTIFTK